MAIFYRSKYIFSTFIGLFLLLHFSINTVAQKKTDNRDIISLAGDWQFQLDPQSVGHAEEWFRSKLPDTIELPGSCEERGYGVKNTERRVWGLTRIIKYEGKAWYQREFEISADWDRKRIELFLERCHWESTVWIDGNLIDTRNSLSAPHIYDLGVLEPGMHVLTICIDNTYKIPIGTWAHAITEDTQGNWNGIIGRIELTATDPVWIQNVQVYPGKLIVKVGNQTDQSCEVVIQTTKFTIPVGGAQVEFPFTEEEKPWDEFAPAMQSLSLSLKSEKWSDSKTISYGTRDLSTKNRQFILNGRPLMLRGPVDECIYPLTGYPPMDKESWLRILGISQSYGFNFMRFHSWCPPEAAFQAGDELGFLFQIELPLWTMDAPHFGQHAVRDQFIHNELDLILENYGNHPSFAFMAMGNESSGSLDTLVTIGREKDPRHLYRCENGNTELHGDFYEIGQRGVFGPRTDWNRRTMMGWIAGGEENNNSDEVMVPTFAHEVGQWAMYPDFKEIDKYTGTMRAYNFESYRESLERHHMLDQAEDFKKASGKFSVLLYKDEIEGSLRTYPYGGFQILEARDYPGQGTAIVGWLDAFWDSKELISPEEFRRFCGPTVCLLEMSKRVFTNSETFSANAEIAHYGPEAVVSSPEWSICDENGLEIARGQLPEREIITGEITQLGEIKNSFVGVSTPKKLIVTLSAAGTSNSWNIWVYPASQPEISENIHISYSFDSETRTALSAGKSVLLFSSPKEGLIVPDRGMIPPDSVRYLPAVRSGSNALPGSFMPVFWNTRLFNQIGTLGMLCDPDHPAFSGFPTDEHSDWQWADILGHFTAANSFRVAGAGEKMASDMEQGAGDVAHRSKAIILDETPPGFRPILQIIDNYDRNSKLGTLFETRVGKGKLLVCAMDLDTDILNRPAARQLRKSLIDYVNSKAFDPDHELSMDLLEKLLKN